MTCDEVRSILGEYWDLPHDDIKRKQIQDHMKHCELCSEEYALWEQSISLIQQSSSDMYDAEEQPSISKRVMNRIYADEGWREPIPHRIYSIPYHMRRKLTVTIAFFLALFMLGFVYSVMYKAEPEPMYYTFDGGVMPIASAVGNSGGSGAVKGAALQGVPVASLSDPFVLSVNTFQSNPNYVVVLSLIGIICTLLIMNWLTRIKA